ncbi:hypothetical protein HAX54_004686, partial [Datura stramonium]|nr:hypothetical protein [Datura stramonium]
RGGGGRKEISVRSGSRHGIKMEESVVRVACELERQGQPSCANINRCYREANQVADRFAKHASVNGLTETFCNYDSIPKDAKGPFQLDKSQLPSIRIR